MSSDKPVKNWQDAAVRSKKQQRGRARRRIMVRFGEEAPTRTAFAKNVSETGIYVHTNTVVRPGTLLYVDLVFPDRTVATRGRVVWAKRVPDQLAHILDCGMGLRFVETPHDWEAYFEEWGKKIGVR